MTKLCPSCNVLRPLSAFAPRPTAPDGLRMTCNHCLLHLKHVCSPVRNPSKVRRHRPVKPKSSEPAPEGSKYCTYCGELKELSDYHFSGTTNDEHVAICKSCTSKRDREINARPDVRATRKARAAAYNLEHKAEKAAAHKAWVEANREHLSLYRKQRYARLSEPSLCLGTSATPLTNPNGWQSSLPPCHISNDNGNKIPESSSASASC